MNDRLEHTAPAGPATIEAVGGIDRLTGTIDGRTVEVRFMGSKDHFDAKEGARIRALLEAMLEEHPHAALMIENPPETLYAQSADATGVPHQSVGVSMAEEIRTVLSVARKRYAPVVALDMGEAFVMTLGNALHSRSRELDRAEKYGGVVEMLPRFVRKTFAGDVTELKDQLTADIDRIAHIRDVLMALNAYLYLKEAPRQTSSERDDVSAFVAGRGHAKSLHILGDLCSGKVTPAMAARRVGDAALEMLRIVSPAIVRALRPQYLIHEQVAKGKESQKFIAGLVSFVVTQMADAYIAGIGRTTVLEPGGEITDFSTRILESPESASLQHAAHAQLYAGIPSFEKELVAAISRPVGE